MINYIDRAEGKLHARPFNVNVELVQVLIVGREKHEALIATRKPIESGERRGLVMRLIHRKGEIVAKRELRRGKGKEEKRWKRDLDARNGDRKPRLR